MRYAVAPSSILEYFTNEWARATSMLEEVNAFIRQNDPRDVQVNDYRAVLEYRSFLAEYKGRLNDIVKFLEVA
jgi:hypothetical protein